MSKSDLVLQCKDCHWEFIFSTGEARFFAKKGFQEPKRCPDCRKVNSERKRLAREG